MGFSFYNTHMAYSDIDARRAYMREYMRRRYRENPEPHNECVQKWRDENPEKYRKYQLEWYHKNKERINAKRRERARKKREEDSK